MSAKPTLAERAAAYATAAGRKPPEASAAPEPAPIAPAPRHAATAREKPRAWWIVDGVPVYFVPLQNADDVRNHFTQWRYADLEIPAP